MSRPTKLRRVCRIPETLLFIPNDKNGTAESVILTIDEYEAIRLIDLEGRSQEQCSLQMGIARTTVQKIYDNARKKLAEAMVFGKCLCIAGGEYLLCDGNSETCRRPNCPKKEIEKNFYLEKGENIMRVAVTYENGEIFQHFGRTAEFKVYDIENGEIKDCRVVGTDGQGHGALADVLNSLNVDTLICGGIGGGAQMALASVGIRLLGGVSGSADKAVEAFLKNELSYDPALKCDHHGHEHGEGHICGDHGCGHGHCHK